MTTPALAELMPGYLHQDYDLIGSIEDNVGTFMADFPDLAAHLPLEVDGLLARSGSEDDIASRLAELGCEVRPAAGTSYREWLTQIADRVRKATA